MPLNASATDRAVDFTDDTVWAGCPHCENRCSQTHTERENGDEVACTACGHTFASVVPDTVIARDPDDPVLDADTAARFWWFHSCIHQQWPVPEAWGVKARALHLGTYESAVEMMLHRMAFQSEADIPFYLHRVTINPTALIDPMVGVDVGEGFTGFVPPASITDDGFTVRRYLNAEEHRGAISLAVVPEAIATIQTVALPVASSIADPDPALWAAVAYADTARDAIRAAIPPEVARAEVTELDKLLGSTPDAAVLNIAAAMAGAGHAKITKTTERTYLTGAGERVGDKLRDAVNATSEGNATCRGWHETYRRLVAAVVNPDAVMAALASQPARVPVAPT